MTIGLDVEPVTIGSISQNQAVHYFVSRAVHVASVEQFVNATTFSTSKIENVSVLGDTNAFEFAEGDLAYIPCWHCGPSVRVFEKCRVTPGNSGGGNIC